MSSYEVTVHALHERKRRIGEKRRPKPWRLRWVVAGRRFDRWYATRALADHERAKLMRAMTKGEAFDEATGLPQSEWRARSRITWYEHACSYIQTKWPSLAANSRKSSVEGLVTVTTALVTSGSAYADPDLLRRALRTWAFQPNKWDNEAPAEFIDALDWITQHSLPLLELAESDTARAALNACTQTLEGKPAAATTANRKRAVLYNALGYAVERRLFDYNPIDKIQWKTPEVAEQIDRRVVASTAQVERILAAVPTVNNRAGHYVAFFGCLYYAGMRPSEAVALRRDDCTLPRKGWGHVTLTETAPPVGSDWTDDGTARDVRGLKHRGRGHTRTVPIPPELVRLLRTHVDTYGLAPDGRFFHAPRGGYLPEADYARIWKVARAEALAPRQVSSPLAARPYDLRHAAVSLWLNGGVPAPEVAKRAGHGVAVLLKVYAGCIDGEEKKINASIGAALERSRARGAARVQKDEDAR